MSGSDVLTGLAFVLVVEGLVYALAPSAVERLLEALRSLPMDARRLMGLACIATGLAMLWALKSF